MDRFRDRRDAGARLALELKAAGLAAGALVLALPRGGVPVGFEIARSLGVPLDVFVVRKLGVPGHEELAMGAIASGGVRFLNNGVVAGYRIPQTVVDAVEERELRRVEQLEGAYRATLHREEIRGRAVIVADDGVATGATMQAAVGALRHLGARWITVAVPVGARDTLDALRRAADEVVCLLAPRDFRAVGLWYEDFAEVSDEEVRSLLKASSAAARARTERDAAIPAGRVFLAGSLAIPSGAQGLVIFAHGSGSSRHSPRNRYVAGVLREAKLATLLMDLLTPEEERAEAITRHLRFDIELLASRLKAASAWAVSQPGLAELPQGYFGASTGAAAALVAAAADRQERVLAIVSRGGRPDLAPKVPEDALERVSAATLLLVGSRDEDVLELNRQAKSRMRCTVELKIVPGATHLFEEPGALEKVAALAGGWFEQHLVVPSGLPAQ